MEVDLQFCDRRNLLKTENATIVDFGMIYGDVAFWMKQVIK